MVHVGTSGWSFTQWRDHFYPHELSQKQWLAYYARHFSTVELNAAFYRVPSDATIAGWRDGVPGGFLFSVKASQRLTHRREAPTIVDVEWFVTRLEALGDRLGPFLFQFPPTRKRDDEWLRAYLAALPAGSRYAFEFRHPSWYDDAIFTALKERGVALVMSDHPGAASEAVRTTDFGYVRLRGPAGNDERYPPEELDAALRRIQRLFDPACDIYVYFHHGVAGIQDALALPERCGISPR
ncbi:DUF72 domain-containing protein [bacterium]|nr:MAG: DUF72 domain-containing protein [bacterium]